MWDPLLDTNVRIRTWWDVADEVQHRIEWAVRKNKPADVAFNLNVLDLIDVEASAYWREWGVNVHGGRSYTQPKMAHRVADDAERHEAVSDQEFEGISLI